MLLFESSAKHKPTATAFVAAPTWLPTRLDVKPVIKCKFFNTVLPSSLLGADKCKRIKVVTFMPNVKQSTEVVG